MRHACSMSDEMTERKEVVIITSSYTGSEGTSPRPTKGRLGCDNSMSLSLSLSLSKTQ